MFYFDEDLAANAQVLPIPGEVPTNYFIRFIRHLSKNDIVYHYDVLRGQILTFNGGFSFNEEFSVFIFSDGVNSVISALKKIDVNNFQIIEDITGLNSNKITMKLPRLPFDVIENGSYTDIEFGAGNIIRLEWNSFKYIFIIDGVVKHTHNESNPNNSYGKVVGAATSLTKNSIFYNKNGFVIHYKINRGVESKGITQAFKSGDFFETGHADDHAGSGAKSKTSYTAITFKFTSSGNIQASNISSVEDVSFLPIVYRGRPSMNILVALGGTNNLVNKKIQHEGSFLYLLRSADSNSVINVFRSDN